MTADGPEPESPGSGLRGDATRGVLWLAAQKWLTRIGGLVTLAVLTRLVTPEEFGVVAAATTIIPVVYLVSDLGFSTYIAQAKVVDRSTLSTGFWFSSLAGAVLAGALYLAAPAIADAFRIEQLTVVLRALTPAIAFAALQSVPVAVLRRRMQFPLLARQGVVAATTAQVVAIGLALGGSGVWALVAQLLVSQVVSAAMAWRAARWRPAMEFSASEFRTMAVFGGRVVSVELVAAARGWGEAAVVAMALGATGLGYLAIARRLVDVTQDLSAAAVLPVSTVVFARLREHAPRLRAAYLRALGASYGAVSLPLAFLAVAAPLLVPLAFGAGWGPSVLVVQILALAAILTLGAALDHGLHYGSGRPGTWLVYALVVDAITLATAAVAVRRGLVGVAVGFLIVAAAATVSRWALVARILECSPRVAARPLVRLLPIVVLDLVVGQMVWTAVRESLPVVALAVTGGAMTAVHLLLVRMLAPSVLTDLVEALRVRQALVRCRVAVTSRGSGRRAGASGTARPPEDPAPAVVTMGAPRAEAR